MVRPHGALAMPATNAAENAPTVTFHTSRGSALALGASAFGCTVTTLCALAGGSHSLGIRILTGATFANIAVEAAMVLRLLRRHVTLAESEMEIDVGRVRRKVRFADIRAVEVVPRKPAGSLYD